MPVTHNQIGMCVKSVDAKIFNLIAKKFRALVTKPNSLN